MGWGEGPGSACLAEGEEGFVLDLKMKGRDGGVYEVT